MRLKSGRCYLIEKRWKTMKIVFVQNGDSEFILVKFLCQIESGKTASDYHNVL